MSGRPARISPSLMCADLLALGNEVRELVELGVDYLHLDIMDGHYVPNLTLGTDLARSLASQFSVPLDIHLMVDEPDTWVQVFLDAAAPGPPPYVTIHPETTWHPARTLAAIRTAGGHPGIAVDPALTASQSANLLELADLVLVMTVNPGYAGQQLLPWTLDNVEWLANERSRRGLDFLIEVDGNVSWKNIPGMLNAGADVLVAGSSSLFDANLTRSEAMKRLRDLISPIGRM